MILEKMLLDIISIFVMTIQVYGQSQVVGLTAEQLNMVDKVVTCRAHCVDAFGYRSDLTTDFGCQMDSDCLMCWENCEMFYRTFEVWGPMCDEPSICFDGCRLACAVYRLNPPTNAAHVNVWAFTQQVKVLRSLSLDQLELRWSPPIPLLPMAPPMPRMVYALFWKLNTQPDLWLPLNHTVSTTFYTMNLEVVRNGMDFMVLAYTRDGRAAVTQLKESPAALEIVAKSESDGNLSEASTSRQSGSYFRLPLVGYISLIVIACVLTSVVAIIMCKHFCFRSYRLSSINSNRAIRFRRVAALDSLEKRLSLINRGQSRNDGVFASNTNLLNVKRGDDKTPTMERAQSNYENWIEAHLPAVAPLSLYCDSPDMQCVRSEGNCLLKIMDRSSHYGGILVDPEELRHCLNQQLPIIV